jgi:hypothetical protein
MADSIRNEVKIPLPAWIIVDPEKHAAVGLPTSSVVLKDHTHMVEDYLPIFSTVDLASTFIEKSKGTLGIHVPLKLESLADIRDLLVKLQAAGGQHVGIDITIEAEGHFGEWLNIAIILKAIDAALN